MQIFAEAREVLLDGPTAISVDWWPAPVGAMPSIAAVRCLQGRRDEYVALNGIAVPGDALLLEVSAADVTPKAGDEVVWNDTRYRVLSASLDDPRLWWSVIAPRMQGY